MSANMIAETETPIMSEACVRGRRHARHARERPVRAWRIAGTAVLVAAILCLAALVLAPAFGLREFVVRSGSMATAAPTGSLVVARPISADAVKVGDIIAIQRVGAGGTKPAPVLHRVIARRVEPSGAIVVTTKGDANRTPDPLLYTLPATTSTPVVVIPRFGYVLVAVRSPLVWFAAAGVGIGLAALVFMLRVWTRRHDAGR